jgi:hypothetical protein
MSIALESAFVALDSVLATSSLDNLDIPRVIDALKQVGRAIERADLRHMLLEPSRPGFWDARNASGQWARAILQQSHDPEPETVRKLFNGVHRLEHLRNHFRRFLQDALAEQATLGTIYAGAVGQAELSGNERDPDENQKPKGKRGRKPDTDPKMDSRVADAWQTGQYRTYAECGREFRMNKKQVKQAIDRHRKRQPAEAGKRHRQGEAPE